jgi:exosome complex RNA-binding protein Rrp42 (RNase PH superfamily)
MPCRQLSVSCGVLPQSNGSARVRLAQGNTEVVASVKADLVAPSADKPDEGVLECNVECWTSSSPHYLGRTAADIHLELTDQLNR